MHQVEMKFFERLTTTHGLKDSTTTNEDFDVVMAEDMTTQAVALVTSRTRPTRTQQQGYHKLKPLIHFKM